MLLEEIKERKKLICPQFGYTPTRSATLDSVIDEMDTTCFVSSSILFLTQVFLFFSFLLRPTHHPLCVCIMGLELMVLLIEPKLAEDNFWPVLDS
jgi:hypothetical protein